MKKNVKNPLNGIIQSWKKIDSEKRLFIIIIVLIFAFIAFMPEIYKGWVNFRDHGFHFGSKPTQTQKPETPSKPSEEKTLTMTCTQSITSTDYKTDAKVLVTHVDNKLKSENYELTMTAFNEAGKEELPVRKALYDLIVPTYQSITGFQVTSELNENTFIYHLITDYAKVDYDAVNKTTGDGRIFVEFEFNQNMNSVKSYYQNLGFTCKE